MKTPEKIETEAALWVVRLERGLTAEEQDIFLEWLTADPRHGNELNRQSANWAGLNLLADWRPEHGARPNRDLLAPTPARPLAATRPALAWVWGAGFAAAAAIAIGFFAFSHREIAPVAPLPAAPGQISSIEKRTLDDGTEVELNRGAEISVLYTATERTVRLDRGEAMFRVAKNPQRPFVVTVDGVHFRAIGTAFNVRRAPATVELIVTEGTVQVRQDRREDSGDTPLIEGGHLALVPMDPASSRILVAKIAPAQVDEKLSWQSRLLDFTNTRLAVVVEEFNRRNAPIRLVIEDAELADTEVSASLRSDNLESFIRLLEGGFAIDANRQGNVVTLRKRP